MLIQAACMQDRAAYPGPIAALAALMLAGPALAQQPAPAPAAAPLETEIGLIYRPQEAPASYDAEAVPEDEGVAGARMGIADDNTWLSEFSSGRKDFPLLFDTNHNPKKAFWAVVDF